jgi:hypothetical protein
VVGSGLLNAGDAAKRRSSRTLAVLDLGIGCGDQTLELASLLKSSEWRRFLYVGITSNRGQVDIATQRLGRSTEVSGSGNVRGLDEINLFCADAAKPDSWSAELREEAQKLIEQTFTDKWVLALDSLYHFSPSRIGIFGHTAKGLGASFMAYDLILNSNASFWEKLAVKAIGVAMQCPLGAFIEENEYRRQLTECGFDSTSITITDISEQVFPGLVQYIEKQGRMLQRYGISIRKFTIASRVFEWFHTSKAIKGVIVVAHSRPKTG